MYVLLVKKNNPLMGTETELVLILCKSKLYSVKLNNPLMGTEMGFSLIQYLL